ncbi:gefF, partial [Symbiodinium pilosum]
MLVFAGSSAANQNDLWRFSWRAGLWTELLSETRPPARSRHSAILDSISQSMIIFGGWSGSVPLHDPWHCSLWTRVWTLLQSPPGLAARAGHTAVLDSVSVSMLVFGGIAYNNESFSYAGDLWNYSLVTDSWSQLAPPGPYPSPEGREDHS